MEYFCHYCHDWLDSAYCESHFDSSHNQKNVTFDSLKKRMDALGGLMTRVEPQPTAEPDEKPKPKNWLFADEEDGSTNGTFVTNNFQHNMR